MSRTNIGARVTYIGDRRDDHLSHSFSFLFFTCMENQRHACSDTMNTEPSQCSWLSVHRTLLYSSASISRLFWKPRRRISATMTTNQRVEGCKGQCPRFREEASLSPYHIFIYIYIYLYILPLPLCYGSRGVDFFFFVPPFSRVHARLRTSFYSTRYNIISSAFLAIVL